MTTIAEPESQSFRPLEGLVGVTLGDAAAGHIACSFLSDLGAEIIRIEDKDVGDTARNRPPYKNDASLSWPILTRSSKSATCNLSDPRSIPLLQRLMQRADVVCESMGAGVLEDWGLGPAGFEPRLVMLRISGYGQDGPYRDFPADDLTASAYSGLLDLTGHRGGPPLALGTALTEHLCGAFGAQAAIAALYGRLEGGRGATIDAPLYGGALRITEWAIPSADRLGVERERQGNFSTNAAPLGVYLSRDEEFVTLVGGSDANFRRLTKAMHEPEMASDLRFDTPSKRAANADELNSHVQEWAASLDIDAIEELCHEHGVPCGRVYDASDILADQHFRDRGDLTSFEDHDVGSLVQSAAYPRFVDHPLPKISRSSAVGEDNEYVWRELAGFSSTEYETYQSNGLI